MLACAPARLGIQRIPRLSTLPLLLFSFFFFFNDPATTEIYTLSLHDALPILRMPASIATGRWNGCRFGFRSMNGTRSRSEEHTSELQSQFHLVCRLLLEKKKKRHPQKRNSRTSRTTSTPHTRRSHHGHSHTAL